jgi:opacity protein-like surface antigen
MARYEPRLALDWTDSMRRASSIRRALALAAAMWMTAAEARAQTPAATADRGYAEAVAESSFSNVTSQSYGAEVGFTVQPSLQVFGSFGNMRNLATDELSTSAQTIASALSQLQSGSVSFTAKEPATFFVGGVRYRFTLTSTKLTPYVSGGLGIASVSKDVKFFINGSDASSTLPQYVTLGSDVSGSESKLMFTLGGGVVWPAWQQLIVDLHYVYSHISTDTAISVSRVGAGLGVRF